MRTTGFRYLLFGFSLVLFGAVTPFLITLEVIQNNYLLCFLAYAASVVGLFLGIFGAIQIKFEELDK
jgi:cytochrome c biogenesis protein CcdA